MPSEDSILEGPIRGTSKLIVFGAFLGLLAPALQVLLDPHLRPIAGRAWLSAQPAGLGAFTGGALISCALAWLVGPGSASWRRHLGAFVYASSPSIGVALWLFASPRVPLPWYPKRIGVILTSADLALVAMLAVVQLGVTLLCVVRRTGRASRTPRGVRWRVGGAVLAVAAGLGLALGLAGTRVDVRAGNAPVASQGSVVLIGVDGMDWAHLRPRIDRGLVPTLAALVKAGASGPLSTFRPTASPLLWTTIATGQSPLRHGVLHFLDAETKTPYTSNSRRVPALWNLLSDRGVKVGVVGWWVTWPAEPVNGAMVSSYSTPDVGTIKGMLHAGLDGQTHPPGLTHELAPYIAEDIDGAGAEMRSILRGYRPPPQDENWQKRVQVGSWVLAADRMFARAGVVVADRFDPQLLAIYLAATDTIAHAFCHNNPWRAPICERAVDLAYSTVDRALARVLAAADPEATVVIVSDHGFDLVIGHKHGLLHGPPGVAIVKGPGVKAGASLEAATIYDVAPTVLALAGVPLPIDQPGRPWLGILESDRLAAMSIVTGPPMVPATPPDEALLRPIPAPSDDAMRDRLRALGYIE